MFRFKYTITPAQVQTAELRKFYKLEIQDQDYRLRNYSFGERNSLYRAKNGWSFMSVSCPEVCASSKTIYILGNKDANTCLFRATDAKLSEIQEALAEFQEIFCGDGMKEPHKPHRLTGIFK